MRRPRLHWFWRGAIALVVACTYGGLSVTVFEHVHEALADAIVNRTATRPASMGVGISVAWFAPVALLALATYGLLTIFLVRPSRDDETRCRKCGYILRGITEPRCPECGERI